MSIDRPSRFVVAWACGPRTAARAAAVVRSTRRRTADHAGIPWISDGGKPYAETLAEISCAAIPADHRWRILKQPPGVRLTQAVKQRQGRRLHHVAVRAMIGTPVVQPHTVPIERRGGVLRDRRGCLTRTTRAFAKDVPTWDAAVGLALFEQHWRHPHPALRRPLAVPGDGRRSARPTPAMHRGLTDHRWSFGASLTRPVLSNQSRE